MSTRVSPLERIVYIKFPDTFGSTYDWNTRFSIRNMADLEIGYIRLDARVRVLDSREPATGPVRMVDPPHLNPPNRPIPQYVEPSFIRSNGVLMEE